MALGVRVFERQGFASEKFFKHCACIVPYKRNIHTVPYSCDDAPSGHDFLSFDDSHNDFHSPTILHTLHIPPAVTFPVESMCTPTENRCDKSSGRTRWVSICPLFYRHGYPRITLQAFRQPQPISHNPSQPRHRLRYANYGAMPEAIFSKRVYHYWLFPNRCTITSFFQMGLRLLACSKHIYH